MKHRGRVDRILSASALAVGVALAPQLSAAAEALQPQSRVPSFDAEGRIVRLGDALTEKFQRSGEATPDPAQPNLGIADPIPVGENKVNAMCPCGPKT